MKLLISIVPKKFNDAVSGIIGERGMDYQTTVNGSGTATSEILECLSLEPTDKNVILSLIGDREVPVIFSLLEERLAFRETGMGVAFAVSVTSMTRRSYAFVHAGVTDGAEEGPGKAETAMETRDQKTGSEDMKTDKVVIITICNHGFAQAAMAAARAAGARGGTIIHGRSSLAAEKQKFLGIAIHPEKDILLIVCPSARRTALMNAIAAGHGIASEARGLTFSLPVDDAIGSQFDPAPCGADAGADAEPCDDAGKEDG